MKGIQHIFFDLDHTLWDYDRSAQETLHEIFDLYRLSEQNITIKKFVNAFYEVNDVLWGKYNNGLIEREYIKRSRFREIFRITNLNHADPDEVSQYYMHHCSAKPYLMPDSLVALSYLQERYNLHIITNGFLDSQQMKLKSSGLLKYFKEMITSECSNARKPSQEIFHYSLNKAGAHKTNSVMIGDNPRTDIEGAINAGLKSVLYDPSGRKKSLADYTVQSHMELLKIF